MDISLTRGGTFDASHTMIPNERKCAAMRTKTYRYFVEVKASDRRLSPEGYVFNNERVQTYFDRRFGVHAERWEAMSCENMARTACQDIARLLLREGIELRWMCCCIFGSNGAEIKAEWKCSAWRLACRTLLRVFVR